MQSYFVTTALPYANGDLHLGHLVEMIEADIWVRAQRALGHDVVFLSGNDAHGTPIMLHARKNGMQPAEAVSIFHQKHKETIEKYDISFNTFGRTDTPLNRKYCYEFFEKLLAAGVFSEQLIEQFFDPVENMFLPDRFVKGTCPKCGALDQCGDHCDACGATYDPKTLITPYSVITKAAPVLKTVSHLFLNLDQDRAWLKEILPGRIDESVMAKLLEWLDEPLKPWDITRDEPYYGFEIPGRPNQYFYVWFDAPIGYLSLFEQATGHSFASDAMREMVHFIGKDISYFHAIFWLVLLKHAQFPLPKRINVHGFLTLSGQKMSKSRGISCDPNQLVSVMSADCVRYVLAAKMHGKIEDMNFDISEAVQKINSDLVGKSLNILSRCAKLLQTYRHGAFEPTAVQERGLDMEMVANIQSLYHARSYGQVIALVMKEMQSCNEFLTAEAPWTVLKNDPSDHGAWKTLTQATLKFFDLIKLIEPIMPNFVKDVLEYDHNHKLSKEYEPLLYRLDEKVIVASLFPVEDRATQSQSAVKTEKTKTMLKPEITIDEFAKVDLRVGKVTAAARVEGSDKLLSLKVDIGEKEIQVFSGIAAHISPEQILNQSVVVCVNLAPRKMRFGTSEGMLLAAYDGTNPLTVLTPMTSVQAGTALS